MVSFVSIKGSNSHTNSLGFDSQANFALAREIAAQITGGVTAGSIVTEEDSCGGAPTIPAGVSGALVQAHSSFAVLPAGYSIDLITKPGPAIVIGNGSDDETILSSVKTDLFFVAASGSGTVVAGGGDSRVSVGGSGNWLLETGGGNDVIAAIGAVNATIGAGLGDNMILLGSGHDLVTSTGDDTVFGGTGWETVDASGGGKVLVQGNQSNLVFVGGAGGATILGGSGSDTYFGSAQQTGKQLIVGGSGGNNYLFAGDGLATLAGGGNNDLLVAYGGQNQLLIAGSGNETLMGTLSLGNDTLRAGSGNDLLTGGGGSDVFVGGSGSSTVVSGFGKQVFEFINHEAGGSELVTGIYDPTSIKIDLDGYGSHAVDCALASQTVTNGSVTIGLADGTKVTFQDVTSLSKSNFT